MKDLPSLISITTSYQSFFETTSVTLSSIKLFDLLTIDLPVLNILDFGIGCFNSATSLTLSSI